MSHPLTDLQHSDAFELAFRIQQPAPAQPTACVLLMHGVGGSETNLAGVANDIVQQLGPDVLVVLARGPLTLAPGQYAWFRLAMTAAGPRIDAEQAEASRQILLRFVAQLQAAHGIPPARTVVAGFSQGGIMSAGVALTAPELVAGFGILSGRILPEIEPVMASPERLAHLQAFIGHGEHDNMLPLHWAQRSDQLLTGWGIPHQTHFYPVDHSISPAMQADFLAWLQPVLQKA